jgi:hypothetical protein
MALAAFCGHADAQAQCPELEKLRSEAAEIANGMIGVATSAPCEAYNHFSMTWRKLVRYASDHRELCEISDVSMDEFETRHRGAAKARDNVCASRPHPPFSPDIIQR